ncbi:MAG: ABC transporter permease subunit [Alphaproteobacteria bacterium]|nr:ABC transporter permease subunit [Alphaproteobacteria bacterium]
MILTVARKEFREIIRDGRIKWSALILAVMLVAALATAGQRFADISAERASAQEVVNMQFAAQGDKNPHAAAHYGLYAFKPVTPLSFFDTGVGSYTGVSIWLEAHNQNDAEGEPARDATAIARFGELTAAFTLQMLLPLLVILLAFPSFAGEREAGTLRQVLSMQVAPVQLLFGKALGAAAALSVFIGPILFLGLIGLVFAPGGLGYLGHGVVLVAVYIVYALIFLFLTLAVSANVKSAQAALVVMVGFWAVSSFVLPRAASDVSRLLYPTPSAVSFQANIDEAMQSGLDGVSPDTIVQQRQKQTLALYNAETVEELPINFQGMIFDLQEKLGNEVFDKFYGDLYAIFDQQTGLHQAFSIGSPRMATQLASMELSGTSLNQHLAFTSQAESYRRDLIEGMNRDITFNSEAGQADYRADSALWASIEPFEYQPASLGALLARLGPSFMVMFLWLALSIVAGVLAVRKVKVTLG